MVREQISLARRNALSGKPLIAGGELSYGKNLRPA